MPARVDFIDRRSAKDCKRRTATSASAEERDQLYVRVAAVIVRAFSAEISFPS